MAFNLGKRLEGTAYGVLNEVLAGFHSKDGYARANRYEVMLNAPTGEKGTGKADLQNIFSKVMQAAKGDGTVRKTGLRCESISFPGRNLDTTPDSNIYGPTREIVSGFSFAEITGTFVCSSDMREKLFFETWQRLAFDPQSWALGYYDDYVGSIDIHQLDENDNKRYGVQLIEAFPKTIAEQSLGYGSNDTLHKISVTFSYRYWKNLTDEADLPKSLQSRITEVLVDSVERNIRAQIPKVLSRL
jgi:hypothetical protein|tara:strand:+ start:149 stop:880 length:732 start_codon:yes stop_codon:yes gene_type:complete